MEELKEYKLPEKNDLMVCEPQKNWGGTWTEEKLDAFDKIFTVIKKTPQHRYQILTKRAERMAEYFATHDIPENVWLGVTVEAKKIVPE